MGSTLQLVNALAVSLGAAILTAGLPQNMQALLLASCGGALYLFGRTRQLIKAQAPAVPKTSLPRNTFMDELAQEKEKQEQKKAVEPTVPKQRKNFLEELMQEKQEQQLKKDVEATSRQDRPEAQKQEQKRKERLRRMQARWAQQEEKQRNSDEEPSEPLMYADDTK